MLRKAAQCRSYGSPVLEWRRPGGSVLAGIRQGLQAYLSLPPSCDGVSYSKAERQAHVKVWDSVRTNGIVRESAKAEESATPPKASKGPSVTKCVRRMWEPGAGGWRPGGSGSA